MATEKQIAANQENALKSTGPVTEAGKATVKLNAVKHGLTSKQVLVEGDSAEEFEVFENRFFESLSPHGLMEELLVDRIVSSAWRLRRMVRFEGLAISKAGAFDLLLDGCGELFFNRPIEMTLLMRYETSLERGFYRSLHELQRLQAARSGRSGLSIPMAIDISQDDAG